jgi:hypothetical protein
MYTDHFADQEAEICIRKTFVDSPDGKDCMEKCKTAFPMAFTCQLIIPIISFTNQNFNLMA